MFCLMKTIMQSKVRLLQRKMKPSDMRLNFLEQQIQERCFCHKSHLYFSYLNFSVYHFGGVTFNRMFRTLENSNAERRT